MTTDFSSMIQPPSPNPYINPSPELHYYTENFKEFPIIVPNNLPFFPVSIYKIAIIKSVEQLILISISNSNAVAKELLNRVQYSYQDLTQCEEAIQLGLIKPVANAMEPVMNIQSFQHQLCWVLSEFNCKSGLNTSIDQIGIVTNILVNENISIILEQVASKACKSVVSLIRDLVKDAILKQSQNQSMQSAKVMYGSYLSPLSPSNVTSSLLLPEKPSYSAVVKNLSSGYTHGLNTYPSDFNNSSQGHSSDFVLPSANNDITDDDYTIQF